MDTENDKTPFFAQQTSVQQEKPADLTSQETIRPSFRSFAKTNASSYLATLTLAAASVTAILVFQNQDNLLRTVSGLLLTLGLPGFALVKTVFPAKTLGFEKQGRMGWLFTGAFSVVMSIIVVSLVAFALDLTPFGVTLVSLNLSLFSLTLLFGTVGLWRRYNTSKIEN